jgi:hypothetical protein
MVQIDLHRYGAPIDSLFDLLGSKEVGMTSALGFALSRCETFRALFLLRLHVSLSPSVSIRLETVHDESTNQVRTDIEIDTDEGLLILEAKLNWNPPEIAQLRKQAEILKVQSRSGLLVTLCQAPNDIVARQLGNEIDGVPLRHVSWKQVLGLAAAAKAKGALAERKLLAHFESYLYKVIRMRQPSDMSTYCVSVSNALYGTRPLKSYVVDDLAYFHPYGWGKGWPTLWPNFLAFRWEGKVQQVHRVKYARVIQNLTERWPETASAIDPDRPHVVYDLEPALSVEPLPMGDVWPSGRYWVLLDQLISGPTLKDAIERSKVLQSSTPFGEENEETV